MSFAVGESIAGRYRLDRLLGSGASSDAYLAQDLDLQAPRVLKIGLRPTPGAAREALEREYSFLKHRRNASFPACFASLACSGHTILVLEYVDGQTLDEASTAASPSGLLAVANRLLDVLEALHATGNVCRDLKPQNVLVPTDLSSPWKLIDLSTVCEEGESPQPVGTPEFAAPEVVSGRSVSKSADLYSLGKTIRHLAEARSVDLPPPVDQLLEALTESDAVLRPDLQQTRSWIHALWVALGTARPVCLTCLSTASCDCSLPQTLLARRSRLVLELVDRSLKGGQQAVVRWFLEGKAVHVGRLPLEPHDRLDLAQALCKSAQPESALSLLEEDDAYRTSGSPRQTLASLQLRLTFQVRGADEAAKSISAWADALASDPKWVRNASRVLHQLHRTKEGVSLLRRCLELEPTDGPTHACLAGLLDPGPERDHHLHEAAFGEPPDIAAVEQLCREHEAEGRLRQAITLALGAARALPQDVRPKQLYADLCLRESSSWPTLESELRAWSSVHPDDGLLERLVALYARSDKWRLLLDESLPAAKSPGTRALLRVAQAAASRNPSDRLTLDDLEWNLASPLRWLPVLGELTQRLVSEGEASKAEAYVARLPESFTQYLDVLKTPPEPAPSSPVTLPPPVVSRPPEPVAPPQPAQPTQAVPGLVPYPQRSRFVAPLLEGLLQNRSQLELGEAVAVALQAEKAGFPGNLRATIDQDRSSGFMSDWSGADVTLFPARLRAAAWALYRMGAAGEFALSHNEGLVTVRWLDPPATPAPTPVPKVESSPPPTLRNQSPPLQESHEWVREHRLAMGLTQSQFALSVGSSQPRVSQIERGVVELTPAERQAFRAYFASGGIASPAAISPTTTRPRNRPCDPNRAFLHERAKGLTIEDMRRGVEGGGPPPSRVPPPAEPPASAPPVAPPAPARAAAGPTPVSAPPQVFDDKQSRRLQGSAVWQRREESLPSRVDRSMIYRLIDALAASRSLHEREVAQLLGIPQRRLPGFVAQVARGLNIGGEPVIAHDRRGQSIALDVTLMQQCFELPQLEG